MIREIDKNGRCVIPKEMRKALGLENSDSIKFELVGNKIIITNPDELDPFDNWLNNYILRTESSEAKNIYVKYQELKK